MEKKLSQEEFWEAVRAFLSERLGRGYSLWTQKIQKNNGTGYTGLVVHKEHVNLSPVINLEEPYRKYLERCPFDEVAEEVYETYRECCADAGVDPGQVTDWQRVKGCLLLKVISTELNRELLRGIPHREVEDLSMVLYVEMRDTGGKDAKQMLVRNGHLCQWGQCMDALYETAMENTMKTRVALTGITNAITNVIGGDDAAECLLGKDLLEKESPLFVLTNTANLYGAVFMVLPQVMEHVADLLGEDVYVIPSSIHESLVAPVSKIRDLAELRQIVCDVNMMHVPLEERLSDHVYLYRKGKGLSIAA